MAYLGWIPFWHIDGRTTWVRKHGSDKYRKIRDGAIRLLLEGSTLYVEALSRSQNREIINAIHNIKSGNYSIEPGVIDPEDADRIRKGLTIKKILIEFVGTGRASEYENVEELEVHESKSINGFKRKLDIILSL